MCCAAVFVLCRAHLQIFLQDFPLQDFSAAYKLLDCLLSTYSLCTQKSTQDFGDCQVFIDTSSYSLGFTFMAVKTGRFAAV